ncbi:MAG: acylphosphatase [Phycisphaeraceae bacterium]
MIRKVVHYSGRVQGVGFRYTTANLAKRFDVAGYVRNLPDGQVLLDVQGSPDQVQGLLDAIDGAMVDNIKTTDVSDRPVDELLGEPHDPDTFGIRYRYG